MPRTTAPAVGHRTRASLVLTLLIATVTLTACGEPGPPYADGPEISTLLVGNNVWASPTEKTWEATAQADLRIVRIGGIAFDDNVPGDVLLDAWVREIRDMGAEPLIQVSRYDTPEEAARLVAHFNEGTEESVTYWSIGNEPFCGDATAQTAVEVAAYVKPIATAMKEADPTIKIFGPDECDYYEEYYRALFSGDNGPADISGLIPGTDQYYVDGVAWHRYIGYPPAETPIDGLTTEGVDNFVERIQQTRALVDNANAAQGRTGDHALEWAIPEFNAKGGERVCSFENGQMIALVYGAIMEYDGLFGALWSLQESGGSCTGTDHGFLNARNEPRPSYFHMQMVSRYFAGTYVAAQSTSEAVRTYGAVDRDLDRVTVMLLNIDTEDSASCTVVLDTATDVSGGCTVTLPVGVVDASAEVTLAPQTTVVLVFDLAGKLVSTVTYQKDSEAPIVDEVS